MIKNNIQEMVRSVAAIVVTYNPVFSDFTSYMQILKKQFPLVIVVDNSECLSIKSRLLDYFSNNNQFYFLSLDKNYGIARAQNLGVEHCVKLGFKYFCEFDQDSSIEHDFLERMLRSYLTIQALNDSEVAAVGPNAVDIETNIPYRKRTSSDNPVMVETTLSSGLIVSVDAYLKVGPKAEELFIDLVDWEWCFRAQSLGLSIYVDPEIKIFHKLGNNHISFLGIFRYGVPAPFRHYYAFRNYINLTRRGYIPLRWKIKYLFINIGKLALYPLIMSSGYIRFKYMCLGIYDGIFDKTGKL